LSSSLLKVEASPIMYRCTDNVPFRKYPVIRDSEQNTRSASPYCELSCFPQTSEIRNSVKVESKFIKYSNVQQVITDVNGQVNMIYMKLNYVNEIKTFMICIEKHFHSNLQQLKNTEQGNTSAVLNLDKIATNRKTNKFIS
jgi:hypothetical protein